jgi:hypothetical protein
MVNSLPCYAIEYGLNLDALRAVIRSNPQLAGLGKHFGPRLRLYTPQEFQLIREAYEAKRKSLKKAPAGAA